MTNKLVETQDGSHSLLSGAFGVSYHSKYGAVQETQHVFINSALRLKAVIQKEIAVLDIGFGTGLNAFMTYLEAKRRNLLVHYTGVEAFPVSEAIYTQFNYAAILKVPQEQANFLQLHRSVWNKPIWLGEQFCFQK